MCINIIIFFQTLFQYQVFTLVFISTFCAFRFAYIHIFCMFSHIFVAYLKCNQPQVSLGSLVIRDLNEVLLVHVLKYFILTNGNSTRVTTLVSWVTFASEILGLTATIFTLFFLFIAFSPLFYQFFLLLVGFWCFLQVMGISQAGDDNILRDMLHMRHEDKNTLFSPINAS